MLRNGKKHNALKWKEPTNKKNALKCKEMLRNILGRAQNSDR